MNFTSQLVGTPSGPAVVTITNSGSATLNISSVNVTGDYSQTNNCGTTVAVGANCQLTVIFTPTATGQRPGTLTITDDAGSSPQVVNLSGTGSDPSAVLSPTSLDFGSTNLGSSSSPQTVTLTNNGTADLIITNLSASRDFSQTNTCGSDLPVGANCSINVVFSPTVVGQRTGTLTVTDNDPAGSQTASLTGNGVGLSMVTLAPASVTFPDTSVGSSSNPLSVTLTNSGTADLNIASVATAGDFSQTNTCPALLQSGSSCVINVVFGPTQYGTETGMLIITDDAADSPQSVTLSGNGVP